MLEIHIPTTDLQDANTSITWCIDKETLNDIITKQRDVKIFIEVGNKKYSNKYLFPITDLMAFINFPSHGDNYICATLIEGKQGFEYAMRYYPDAKNTIFDIRNSSVDLEYYGRQFLVETSYYVQKVNVPRECFAPDPNPIEKIWLDFMLEDKLKDQCSLRKRRLFAYTLQPFVFILYMLFKIILFAGAFLLTYKALDIRGITKPFDYDLAMMFNHPQKTHDFYILPKKDTRWKLLLFFFSPLFLILVGSFYICVKLQLAIGGFVFFLISLFSILIIASVIYYEKEQKTLSEQDINLLICSDQKFFTLNDLPEEKRTLKLRFAGLKNSICRPFSR